MVAAPAVPGLTAGCATMKVVRAAALAAALATVAFPGRSQSFVYVEAGLAGCPAAPVATSAAPKEVPRGTAQSGRIQVGCGFKQGSYTLSLDASDPDARFSPKTFVVNFGRMMGSGSFTVTFANAGVHTVSVTITSNMGSPAVEGRFLSSASTFQVVAD